MARCVKCLMDPCLCHIGGFGPEEDENTAKKELEELMGKRCVVKITEKGNKTFLRILRGFHPDHRTTDVTGRIIKMQVILDSEVDESLKELIDLELDNLENNLPPGTQPLPIFFIQYDTPGNNNIPGHWYIDEEVIY